MSRGLTEKIVLEFIKRFDRSKKKEVDAIVQEYMENLVLYLPTWDQMNLPPKDHK